MKKIITGVTIVFNLSTFFIIGWLWTFIGAWSLLYFFVWLTIFLFVSNKYGIFEYTEEELEEQRLFAIGKTHLGYDYFYGVDVWRDDETGEIIEC